MGRPAKTRRLADIDPSTFALVISKYAADHIASLLHLPQRKVNWPVPVLEDWLVEDILVYEATTLAHYAKTGERLAVLPSGVVCEPPDNSIEDVVRVVCRTLFSYAMVDDAMVTPDDVDLEPASDLGIVLLAAQARIRLARNEAVPVRELACLANIDPDHVRLLARDGQMIQGQMALVAGGIASPIAREWLAARGVTGEWQ